MHLFRNSTFRLAAAMSLAGGLASAALACGSPFRTVLNCNHEDFVELRDGVPFLVLDVAGAGCASQMQGAVVLISQDYTFNLATGVGHAIFKFRDCSGDVLATTSDLLMVAPPAGHFGGFEGTWTVDGAASTGRFAGAEGGGIVTGWADNDGPEPTLGLATHGQGHAEYSGSITLKPRKGWRAAR